ncbi:hypothetical protein [Paracoccus jiaweipingae]
MSTGKHTRPVGCNPVYPAARLALAAALCHAWNTLPPPVTGP